ncbi:hypothetical protein [Streptomyces sp. NPDC050504]|uniref:hypothetical protein n=1 Tax=Streptomyces sp. NPDC050504 TaxID=3365618 RepID=UPI0037A81112
MSITTTTRTTRVFCAEVVAVGPVDGGTVRVVLGSFRSSYVGLVVRWLVVQAHRVADGLDPAPDVRWVRPGHRGVLVSSPVWDRLPSAPGALRAWCGDRVGRRVVCGRLREGLPVVVEVADHTGAYALRVVPVRVRRTGRALADAGRIP